ncbi:MAG TPA: hypothetical protein VFY58_05305 [Nocardioides sp.]|nr:hypothetical protein [Nocardioides sp.]
MTEPRRRRHLLDPADLRGSHQRSIGSPAALTNVQRWVMSVLLATTLLHFSAGIAVAAVLIDDDRVDARIVLNLLAAVTGVLAVAAARAIHGKKLVSPWLLVGVLPGVVGAFLTFG